MEWVRELMRHISNFYLWLASKRPGAGKHHPHRNREESPPAAEKRDSGGEPYSDMGSLKEEDDLPRGWEALLDEESGDTYYHCTSTGETTWTRPAPKVQSPVPVPKPRPKPRPEVLRSASAREPAPDRPRPKPRSSVSLKAFIESEAVQTSDI